MLLSAPSKGGKTTFVAKLLREANRLFDKPPRRIYFAYKEWQPLFDELNDSMDNITFYQVLPTRQDVYDWTESKADHTLLVLDDLMMDCTDKETELFTVISHHRNTSVVMMLQTLFPPKKCMRTISLNTNVFVLFRNPRDKLQIQTFGRQVFPGQVNYFLDAFDKATSANENRGYLLVDLSPGLDPKFQLRTRVFEEEEPMVVFAPA